jgi:hypothetical protein
MYSTFCWLNKQIGPKYLANLNFACKELAGFARKNIADAQTDCRFEVQRWQTPSTGEQSSLSRGEWDR